VITRVHSRECHLGFDSPLGVLARRNAQVLLLGVGYEKTTAFHLAEYRVDPVSRTYCSKILETRGEDDRTARWVEYQGIWLDDSDFELIGKNMEAQTSFVRRGMVGDTASVCFPMIDAVQFAEKWMRDWRRASQTLPTGDGAQL
jgi:aminoglycoside 3-N-acetyltransferase